MSQKQLTVQLINGVLTIQIGVATLAKAARYMPGLEAYDEKTGKTIEPKVTDPLVFAKEVVRALNDEEEDGTTPVHTMLDRVILVAIENGAEGIMTGDDILAARRQKAKAK